MNKRTVINKIVTTAVGAVNDALTRLVGKKGENLRVAMVLWPQGAPQEAVSVSFQPGGTGPIDRAEAEKALAGIVSITQAQAELDAPVLRATYLRESMALIDAGDCQCETCRTTRAVILWVLGEDPWHSGAGVPLNVESYLDMLRLGVGHGASPQPPRDKVGVH